MTISYGIKCEPKFDNQNPKPTPEKMGHPYIPAIGRQDLNCAWTDVEGRVEGIWGCLFAHSLHSADQKSVVRTPAVFQIWVWKR